MRTRSLLCLAGIVVSSVVVPSSAEVSSGKPVVEHPVAALHASLSGDASTLDRARRALLTTPRAEGGSGLIPLTGEAGGRRAAFPHTSVYPAPDVDGDGKQDVFTVHWPNEGDLAFVVRRGSDAAPIWSSRLSLPIAAWWAAFGLFDVAGDPTPEVVVYRETVEREGTDGVGVSREIERRLQEIIVFDLASGATINSFEYVATRDQLFFAAGWRVTYDDLVLRIDPVQDAGGGGSPDLMIGLLDSEQVWALVSGLQAPLTGDAFSARLFDVASGEQLADVTATAFIAHIFPAPDLDGDGSPELLILRSERTDQGNLVAASLDGRELWRNEADGIIIPLMIEHLRSPETLDVIVGVYDFDTLESHAWAGEDGGEIWSWPALGISPIGDVDGDGTTDLALPSGLRTQDDEVLGAVVDGVTLEVFWQRARHGDENRSEYFCAVCSQDLNGDGIVDPVIDGRILEGNVTLRYMVALDGVAGDELWEMSTTSSLGLPVMLGGDVDGNGTEDVVVPRAERLGRRWSLALQVSDGATLSPIWDATVVVPGEPDYLYASAIDLSEHPGLELVAGISVATEPSVSRAAGVVPSGLLWVV